MAKNKTKSALLTLGARGQGAIIPIHAPEALSFHTDVDPESLREEALPLRQDSTSVN